MQAPDPAVGWIGAALKQVAGLEAVGETSDGDRLDLKQLGEFFLRKAGLPIEADEHDPLRSRHSMGAGPPVSFGAEHAPDVIEKN